MIRKSRPKRIVTVFKSYFKPQRLNRMVKNLFVYLPTIGLWLKITQIGLNKLYEPLMAMFYKKNRYHQKRLNTFDLSKLNGTLALSLRNAARTSRMVDTTSIKYETLNLIEILKKQNEMLRYLVSEQQKELHQQSKLIIEKEKERIRNNHQQGNRTRTRK